MRSLGGVSKVVVTDTAPEAMVPEPRVSAPLVKVIVPVTPEGTVAVIVTASPKVLGLGDAVTVTAGVVLLTTWTSKFEVSVLNLAVILCAPTRRVEVVNVAVVPEITPVPRVVVPSRKVTVPDVAEGKVAVKVTDCV
jgi:hypothetical protein